MPEFEDFPQVVRFNLSKHLPQNLAEKTNDLFFILTAIFIADRSEREITHLTLLTLEKALFQTSRLLAKQHLLFLNTYFFINTYGPYNNVFYRYLEELEKGGLLETHEKMISLTARGLRVASEMIEEVPKSPDLEKVLLTLSEEVERYADDPNLALTETHSLQVIDTTDFNKVKTVEDLIKEINPKLKFEKSSQFKYIEPKIEGKSTRRSVVPTQALNRLGSELAKVEDIDFEQKESVSCLFGSFAD